MQRVPHTVRAAPRVRARVQARRQDGRGVVVAARLQAQESAAREQRREQPHRESGHPMNSPEFEEAKVLYVLCMASTTSNKGIEAIRNTLERTYLSAKINERIRWQKRAR